LKPLALPKRKDKDKNMLSEGHCIEIGVPAVKKKPPEHAVSEEMETVAGLS